MLVWQHFKYFIPCGLFHVPYSIEQVLYAGARPAQDEFRQAQL